MANETTTTTMAGSFFAIWADTNLIQALTPHNVSRPLFRNASKVPSLVYQWALVTDEGPATAASTVVTLDEGTPNLANTAFNSTTAGATAAVAGMMTTLSDEEAAIAPSSPMQTTITLGKALGERAETDMCALYAGFTNVTGTSGVDLTMAQLLEASTSLANRDVTGQIAAVLHPRQVGDLQQDATTSGATYFANASALIGGIDAATLSGYAGNPHGIPVYQTSVVPTANGGADRAGGLFEVGVALGFYEVWAPRIRTERDESGPGEEYVGTACYGVVEIDDLRGQEITTDA